MQEILSSMGRFAANLGGRIRRMEWTGANILALIANVLTIIALYITIHENKQSDDRYYQDKKLSEDRYYKEKRDSDIESKRISNRDSEQAIRDAIQTQTLIDAYKNQVLESKRNTTKDSIQIALFGSQVALMNKSLKSQNQALSIQNQAVEIQRLTDKSDLFVTVDIKPSKIDKSLRAAIWPIFGIYNRGNSVAEIVTIKYMIVVFDGWDGKNITECGYYHHSNVDKLPIGPNTGQQLPGIMAFGMPAYPDSARRVLSTQKLNQLLEESRLQNKTPHNHKESTEKLLSLIKRYPTEKTYYLLTRIGYRDKYQKDLQYVHTASKLGVRFPMFNEKEISFSTFQVSLNELKLLKKCADKNQFDYEKIVDAVRKQGDDESGSVIKYQ